MTQKRSALITGATGFVGSHLARRLVAEGWETHVLHRQESDLGLLDPVSNEVTLHATDGTYESLRTILAATRPNTVFHLASLTLSDHQPAAIEPLIRSNLLFGTCLAEAMVQENVLHLVNTGTYWQHYENKDYSPVNLYAATKQAYEDLLQYYVEARGLHVVTLKLFDTYGPDDPRPKLLNLLKKAADNGESLDMSPGGQLIDLVHVDDVCAAFIGASNRLVTGIDASPTRYFVSSGKPVQVKELVKLVEETLGTNITVRWGKRPYRDREFMKPIENKALPGWSPEISLDQGLRKVLML